MTKIKKPKILIIGIDGAGPELIDQFICAGHLPNIAKIINSGGYGSLQSTTPPTTLPAWTNFMTGAQPSSHGVADFTVRNKYSVSFVGAGRKRLPTWFNHVEKNGFSVGSAWFPATYPPEKLNGYQISGWDSPVTKTGNASFVHPEKLHKKLKEQFGIDHVDFDVIDEFSNDTNWYLNASKKLPLRIKKRTDIAIWLLKNQPVDVAAFYFGETDTACHHFWAFHDEDSPRAPKNKHIDQRSKDTIKNVYKSVDQAVGRLVDAAGENTNFVILSDHGSGGSSDYAVYLNRFLEHLGLLKFKRSSILNFDIKHLRGAAVNFIPSKIRRALFHFSGTILPSLIESNIRFGSIDFCNTMAFSEELTYAPGIWFNQLGREPKGIIKTQQREEITKTIENAADKWLFPNGDKIIKRIIRRQQIHKGKQLHLFPDLILEFNDLNGYTPVCLPSAGQSGATIEKLPKNALLGRKGRSLPGCHTKNGILIVSGPQVKSTVIANAKIHDVPLVLCSLLKISPASWFECVPINNLFTKSTLDANANANANANDTTDSNNQIQLSSIQSYTAKEERIVAARLKRLGYLDE